MTTTSAPGRGETATGQPAATESPAPEPIARRLDTRGLSCPMPIVRTTQAMAELSSGQLLEVIAYSPKSVSEYEAWSRLTGNPLVESSIEGGTYRFVLRKR